MFRNTLISSIRAGAVTKRSFASTRLARDEQLMKVPVVNPADKFKESAEDIHAYGQYLIAAMPKFIQQFS